MYNVNVMQNEPIRLCIIMDLVRLIQLIQFCRLPNENKNLATHHPTPITQHPKQTD